MSEEGQSMTFVEAKESELNAAFDSKWRPRKLSPEAAEKDPFGAWVEVDAWVEKDVRPLRLRLVWDRGRDHIDVECATEGEARRWVSLEILAVAVASDGLKRYLEAFKATLKVATTDQERLPACAAMYPDPLRFVADNMDNLADAAAKAQTIREAEASIAGHTRAILERHGERANDGLPGA